MEDVYIYTPEFELLHIENRLTSVQWHSKYADAGFMELHTDTASDLIGHVLPGAHSDVIVVQGSNAAWVHGMTDISDNQDDFSMYGKSLAHMLTWRTVDPFEMTDTVENIIRAKITEQFMTGGTDKYMAAFALAPVIDGTTLTTYSFADKQKSLLDVVQELCKIDNLGFAVDFDPDTEQYVFRLYRGTDRSADQTALPPLIFSEDDKNIADTQYTAMQDGYKTCGYYEVKDETTEVVTYTEAVKNAEIGFYRREGILSSKTAEEAQAELAKSDKTEQIEGELDGIIRGEDYELGDIITVQKFVGNTLIAQNKRIIEVIQAYESLNSFERPILDEEVI